VTACRISGGFVPFPEQDKENDIRNAQATQAVIQRRRRPKRRSTGVVHLDMDVRMFLVELNFRKQDICAYILSLDGG
jgi:protein phosphatase 1 regulatory subunit 12A